MEPSDTQFELNHILYDSDGNILPKMLHADPKKTDGTGSTLSFASDLVHSVLLADGIHHHVDEEVVEALPERYQKGSSKAKLTWFGALCLAGIGMFVEAYVIITTGQVKTLWDAQFPVCFSADKDQICPNLIRCCGLFPNTPVDPTTGQCQPRNTEFCNADGTYPQSSLCNEAATNALSYSEFAGIMVGMVTFGAIADCIGHNNAGLLTSILMVGGITVMTFMNDKVTEDFFLIFAAFYAVFGLGVGGEYPLTASGAAAHHVSEMEDAKMDNDERRKHRILRDQERTARRGETIAVVFAMQGVGAVVGSLFLLMLLYFSGQSRSECDPNVRPGANAAGVDAQAINTVWRSFYLIGGIFVFMMLAYRGLVVEEGDGHRKLMDRKKRRAGTLNGKKSPGILRILKFYSIRLVGTAGAWLLCDVSFYGLKLFSGPIFADINPSGDLVTSNGLLLVNNIIGMFGYYSAAYVIDLPQVGRRRLQMFSFGVSAILFMTTAALFNSASPAVLTTLYFASNYFGNFGANVTTYVMAAESYPTELRGTCHGLSAFCGKFGALIATVSFGLISTASIFWVCGFVSIAGLVLTFAFSVDLTRVSLAEHDAQLELFLEGRPEAYKGKLNAKEHLSNFELWTGLHGEYQPDWAAKLVRQDTMRLTNHKNASAVVEDAKADS